MLLADNVLKTCAAEFLWRVKQGYVTQVGARHLGRSDLMAFNCYFPLFPSKTLKGLSII